MRTTTFTLPLIGLAWIGAWAAPALAQGDRAEPLSTRADAASTPQNSGSGFRIPGIAVIADVEGGKTAKLTFSNQIDSPGRTVGQTQIGLTFSGTFDEKKKRGFLLTQDGVPGGVGAELSIASIVSTGPFSPPLDPTPGPVRMSFLVVSASAAINVDDFDYLDPVSFNKQTKRQTGFALNGSAGILTASGLSYVGLGAKLARSYESPDKRILCKSATPTPFECVQDIFGPPQKKDSAGVFAVFRTIAPLAGSSPLALEIKPAYDFEQRVFSVEAPIYFFLDSDRKFRGGTILSWNSKDKKVGLGLFIGAPFDLFHR
jgi:hypothetical protein